MTIMAEPRKIEFLIGVDITNITMDDPGKLAVKVQHEWEFKYALEYDARRLFGPLDGTVDGDLRFAPSGIVEPSGDHDDVHELRDSAQRRIDLRSLVENPPQLDDPDLNGCRMTPFGWVVESSFSVWETSDRQTHWNLARVCAIYELTTGKTIDATVKERLMEAKLQLIVRHPLVPEPK